jgi:hypothetical protein
LKLTDGLGLADVGIEGSEGIDWNEQRAAGSKNRTRIMGTLACCEEIPKEKESSLCRQNSVFDLLKSSSVTRASPPVLLNIAYDDKQDSHPPTVQDEVPFI